MNAVVLIGRLVADPELKTTQTGVSICSFRLAVDRRFYGTDGQRQADFIPCTAWRQAAEFVAKHFTKGKLIGVEGTLQSRSYKDRDDARRTVLEVVCDRVEFVGPKEAAGSPLPPLSSQPQPRPVHAQECPPVQTKLTTDYGEFQEITADEDLPF